MPEGGEDGEPGNRCVWIGVVGSSNTSGGDDSGNDNDDDDDAAVGFGGVYRGKCLRCEGL